MTEAIVSRARRPILDGMGRLAGIPLTVALTWFLQLDFAVLEEDYPRDLFGSPLPWHALSIATAPDSEIFAVPLAIDLLVYAGFSVVLVRFWQKRRFAESRMFDFLAASIVWAAGIYGLAEISGLMLLDGQIRPWYDSFAPLIFRGISLPLAH